ncbi:MAG TPA: hypothetical protein VG754_10040, partial [Verrucomicrobiae bacterium]|nr:hypothetical protein [Verrucomicrobiae bacterium]
NYNNQLFINNLLHFYENRVKPSRAIIGMGQAMAAFANTPPLYHTISLHEYPDHESSLISAA